MDKEKEKRKYFVHDIFSAKGPFTLEELISQRISRNTRIWREGFPSWRKARDVEELADYIRGLPPPLVEFDWKKWLRVAAVAAGALVVVGLGVGWVSALFSPAARIAREERKNFLKYLKVSSPEISQYYYEENVCDISGTIFNTASRTMYKDLVIELIFKADANLVIARREFPIDASVNPGSRFKVATRVRIPDLPEEVDWDYSTWVIKGATAVDVTRR